MRLVHYARSLVGALKNGDRRDAHFKPHGLWVSDDDCEDNWRAWCEAEKFRLDALTHIHDVVLTQDADILHLASAGEIDAFTRQYGVPGEFESPRVNWGAVTECYQGIIITPYIWQRRLDGNAGWYYGWDCASGCIWDVAAIASVTLREVSTNAP